MRKKKIKILHVAQAAGGVDRYIRMLLKYLDTDVEVVRNFDEIIAMGAFMGKEEPQDSTTYVINPGLGMAAEQGNGFCLDVIEYYKTIHFDFNNIITVCEHVTRCLKKKGYIGNNKIEKIDGFTLYPTEYFCPKNYYTNEMRMTRNTCSIHHYTSSWSSAKFTRFHVSNQLMESVDILHRVFGY